MAFLLLTFQPCYSKVSVKHWKICMMLRSRNMGNNVASEQCGYNIVCFFLLVLVFRSNSHVYISILWGEPGLIQVYMDTNHCNFVVFNSQAIH